MNPDAKDMAQKIADILEETWDHTNEEKQHEVELISEVLQSQWNAAIMACAKIVELSCNDSFKVVSAEYEKFHNQKIAQAIRNLEIK